MKELAVKLFVNGLMLLNIEELAKFVCNSINNETLLTNELKVVPIKLKLRPIEIKLSL